MVAQKPKVPPKPKNLPPIPPNITSRLQRTRSCEDGGRDAGKDQSATKKQIRRVNSDEPTTYLPQSKRFGDRASNDATDSVGQEKNKVKQSNLSSVLEENDADNDTRVTKDTGIHKLPKIKVLRESSDGKKKSTDYLEQPSGDCLPNLNKLSTQNTDFKPRVVGATLKSGEYVSFDEPTGEHLVVRRRSHDGTMESAKSSWLESKMSSSTEASAKASAIRQKGLLLKQNLGFKGEEEARAKKGPAVTRSNSLKEHRKGSYRMRQSFAHAMNSSCIPIASNCQKQKAKNSAKGSSSPPYSTTLVDDVDAQRPRCSTMSQRAENVYNVSLSTSSLLASMRMKKLTNQHPQPLRSTAENTQPSQSYQPHRTSPFSESSSSTMFDNSLPGESITMSQFETSREAILDSSTATPDGVRQRVANFFTGVWHRTTSFFATVGSVFRRVFRCITCQNRR